MDDLFTKDPNFWRRMGRAVIIGTLAGAATLAFTQMIRFGTDLIWPEEIDYGWLGGEWWWLVVLTGTGLVVGILRTLLPVDDLSGSLTIIQTSSVDPSTAVPAIAISIISLVGGASLGPFDGGVRSGATIGDWYSTIRGLSETEREVSTTSGINGSLGALLTAPILANLFATEMRWPERRNLYRAMLPSLTAAIFGFSVTFAIIGDTFLGVFELPGYDVRFWHFGLAVAFGFAAASLSWALGLTVYTIRRWILPRVTNQVLRATLGGAALGLIAVALPLTIASGKTQLGVAIVNVELLGAGLLVAIVGAKIVAVAISITTGFIGGPVMPALFIGGTAGLAIHALFPRDPDRFGGLGDAGRGPGSFHRCTVQHDIPRRTHGRPWGRGDGPRRNRCAHGLHTDLRCGLVRTPRREGDRRYRRGQRSERIVRTGCRSS